MAATEQSASAIERQSLEIGKWGNLVMAFSGVVASFLSRSDALMIDGLYSGVNFVSAIIAAKITVTVARVPDRRYPFGYDAFEALYVTFRSLVLLGIMAFAAFGALGKIVAYANGEKIPELQFGPILVYSVAMVAICLALAAWHRYNWRRSGKQSEILSTESRAAIVDAVISGGVGGGFLVSMLLQGTALDVIVPVSDSIIVLVLCVAIASQPTSMFLRSLRQVAGASVEPATVEKVREHVQELLQDQPFELLDIAITKMGRSYFLVSYIKPDAPVDGETADAFWQKLNIGIQDLIGLAKTEVVVCAQAPFAVNTSSASND